MANQKTSKFFIETEIWKIFQKMYDEDKSKTEIRSS